jgi:hypothetical protein
MLPRFFNFDNSHFEGLTLHPIEITDGSQVHLRAGQKGSCTENVYREATLGALNDDSFDRALLVVSFFYFVPGVKAGCFLVRKIDVAFLCLALLAHHFDFVAGLNLRLALVIEHLGQRQHAFRLRADVDNHMGRSQLQHCAFDDAIFSNRLLAFGGEVLKRGSKIFAGVLVFTRRGMLRLMSSVG